MKRRSFIRSMLAACVAPMWLPSAGRIWTQTTSIFTFQDDPYPLRFTSITDEIVSVTNNYLPKEILKRSFNNSIWTSLIEESAKNYANRNPRRTTSPRTC